MTFIFDDELLLLLPKDLRQQRMLHSFAGPQSVKHLIESLGVPHTEIGDIFVRGELKSLRYLPQHGDMIEVHAAGAPEPGTKAPRFMVDGHLGRLAAGLRMLGLDTTYRRDFGDRDMLRVSLEENRTLLTRDRRLLMHKDLSAGYLVRDLNPEVQLRDVFNRFLLEKYMQPFSRCIRCNHALEDAAKVSIVDTLQPLTRLYFDDFRQCPACGQVYWRGSHVERMISKISNLMKYASRE